LVVPKGLTGRKHREAGPAEGPKPPDCREGIRGPIIIVVRRGRQSLQTQFGVESVPGSNRLYLLARRIAKPQNYLRGNLPQPNSISDTT
jgi:hypothetical protein